MPEITRRFRRRVVSRCTGLRAPPAWGLVIALLAWGTALGSWMPSPALARSHTQTAAQWLKTLLATPPGQERDAAVDALLELGDAAWPEVRGKLDAIAALRGGEDTVVDLLLGWGQTSYDEAVLRAPKLGDAAARRLVRQILRYKEDERRAKILSAMLGRHDDELLLLVLPELLLTDPPPVLARLEQLVDDPRPNLRAYAIDTLVAQKHVGALQTIVRLLGIEQLKPTAANLNTRIKLIAAAARLGGGTDAAVDPLLAALAVPDQREAALDGLLHVGAPAVKQAIFLLRTADRGRMESVITVIHHLRVQAAPELLPLVTSPEPRTRNLAVDVLAHIAVPEVREPLIELVRAKKLPDLRQGLTLCAAFYNDAVRKLLLELLKDQDVAVRTAALEQLWRAADPETFPSLRHTAARDSDLHVRMLATQAVVGVGDPKGLELLSKLATVNNQEERLAVLQTIGRVGNEGAIPALATQLSDPSDDVFRAANGAISKIALHVGPRREGEWKAWLDGDRGRVSDAFDDVSGSQREFSADGKRLTYLERADGADRTLILLSGPPFRDATHLLPQAWRLQENNRVVVPQRPETERFAVAVADGERQRDLAALVAHLRVEKVVLVADAAGAHLALAFANKHAEQVSHVILLGGPFPTTEALRRLPGEVVAAMPANYRDDYLWALRQHGLLEPELRRRVMKRALGTGLVGDLDQVRRLALATLYDDGLDAETFERAVAEAAQDEVKEARVPTLLVVGERAPWATSAQRDYAALPAPQRKLVQFARVKLAGALPLLEAPAEAMPAILAFLKK